MSTAKDQASGSFTMSDITRDRRRTGWHRPLQRIALASGVALYTAAALAGPQGGRVTHGDGQINRAGNGTTVINQHTDRMSINWESFNVGANERVVFQQPSSSSTALNRIFDQNPSQIFGAVDANGHILLLNPNGILFGETARINIQSLVASSLDLSVEDFKAGNYNLEALANSHGGAIINRGLIKAATGGSVSLVGDRVVNEGLIVADYGQINLAAGRQATLDFDGDGMLLFAVDAPVVENAEGADAAVANSGELSANGGQILLAGNAARGVFGSVVNNEGSIRAMRIDNTGGVISLMGNSGTVTNSGVVDAGSRTGVAGRVEITGDRVGLLDGSVVSASGRHGGGTVLIGGDKLGQNPDVQNASITYVASGARVEADARVSGDGGRVIVFADGKAGIYGELSAHGGELSGDGGFVETSGKRYIDVTRAPDISAASGRGGTWLIDPFDIEIVAGTNMAEFDETVLVEDYTYDPNASTAPGATSQLGVDIVSAALALSDGGTVEITTGVDGAQDGNITWTSGAILDYNINSTVASTDTLMLTAANDIVFEGNAVNALISDSAGGDDRLNLTLSAGGNVTVEADATIDLQGGVLDATFGQSAAALNDPGGIATISGNVSADAASVLTGGQGQDQFILNTSFAGSVNGGDGDDQFALNGGTVGSVNGQAGDDTFTLGGGSAGNIVGGGNGANGDELIGLVAGSDFVVTGAANAGTVDTTQTFASIENLTGRAGGDTFEFVTALSGTASGAGGDDEFTLSGGSAGDIQGGADGASGDTVIGTVGGSDFVVTGSADAGTVDVTQTFSAIENLTGRAGGDTFEFVTALSGIASGAGGDDDFTLSGGSAGDIQGGGNGANGDELIGLVAGSDFVVTGSANAGTVDITQTFASIENLTGRAGGDTFNFVTALSGTASGAGGDDDFTLSGGSAGDIQGGGNGANGDELIGLVGGSDFVVTGSADAGTVDATQTFAGIENLTGRAGADTFEFVTALTGIASGAGGDDDFTLSGGSAGDIQGGGNGANGDELIGTVGGSDFVVTGSANAGTVDITQTFASIENLTGRAGGDTFNFVTALSGTASGAGGDDDFTLSGGSAGDIQGGGNGANGDELIGTVGGSDFVVTGSANAGTVDITQTFASIENLTGRAGGDTFNFVTALSGTASGAGGDDDFTLSGGSAGDIQGGGNGANGDELIGTTGGSAFVVTGSANAGTVDVTQTFASIENLTGGAAVDTFAFVTNLSGTASGLGANDEFTLGGGSAGSIVGGAGGGDTIFAAASGSDFVVTGSADAGTADGGAFTSIENLTGGAGADTFEFVTALSGTASGLGGDDEFTLNGGGAGSIVGGAQGVSGDTLIGTAAGSAFVVSGSADAGNVGGSQTFTGVENLTGGAGSDTFLFITALTGTASGMGEDDEFTLAGGSAGSIAGGADGASGDTLISQSAGNAFVVTGADDAGTVNGDAFAGVENLTGGAGVDAFEFVTDLSGTASGLGGDDEFTLNGGGAGDIQGGGNGANGDELIGNNTGNAFVVTGGPNAGTVNGDTFAGIENLTGGSMADTFSLLAALSGAIAAGGGDDTVTLGVSGSAGSIDGGANGVIGDTLRGPDVGATWEVTAVNTLVVPFPTGGTTGFENYGGGTGDDIFLLNFDYAGNLSGGGGSDTFNLNAGTVTGTLSGDAGADIYNLNGGSATLIDGGAGSDTLFGISTGNAFVVTGVANAGTVNVSQAFTGIDNLTGSTAVDTFEFVTDLSGVASGLGDDDEFTLNGGSVGSIAGGDGTGDELIGESTGNSFVVSGADNAGAANGIAFTGIENLTGGAGVDTFGFVTNLTGAASGLGEDDQFTLGSGSAGSILGGAQGANGDTLIGSGAGSAFVVSGSADAGSVGGTQTFSSIENLTGGAGSDTFLFITSLTGTASGLGDNDEFTLAGGTAGNIDGGTGSGDTLIGESAGNAFVVTGVADAGTVNGDTFAGIENLTGGAGIDTFEFAADLSGTASGLGNDDQFTLNGGSAGRIAGGGGTGDSLIGQSTGNAFVVTGSANAGTVNGDAFSGIENLTGGAGVDTFEFVTALTGSASGLGDDDEFTLNGGSAGSIAGGVGTGDTLFAAATGSAFVVTGSADAGTADGGAFTGIENLTGGAGVDTFEFVTDLSGTASGMGNDDEFTLAGGTAGNIDGGTGSGDTLIGESAGNAFVVTGAADAGTVNGDTFAGIENLTGGAGIDTFEFMADLSGTASGLGDDDQFTLNGGSAGSIAGGGGTGDSLIGQSAGNAFVVSGSANAGTVNGDAFSSIENLTGGAGVDTFEFVTALSGAASGLGDDDQFTLSGGSAGSIVGGAHGANGDTLIGTAAGNAFVVTGTADAGTVNGGAFDGIENLTGGAGMDTFLFVTDLSGAASGLANDDEFALNGGTAGSIDGGAGTADTLIGADMANDWLVTSATTGTLNGDAFANIEDLIGGADIDTLTGDDIANTWTLTAANIGTLNSTTFDGFENLVGGSVEDVFSLDGGSALLLDGGAGNDTLFGDDAGSTFVMTAADEGTVDMRAFTSVENLSGGSANDIFTLAADLSGNVTGRGGDDMFTVSAIVGGRVTGNAGDDSFTLLPGGSATRLDGGAGNDLFNIQVGVFSTPLVGGSDTDEVTFTDFTGANLLVDLSDPVYASFDIETIVGNGQMDSTLLSGGGDDVWQLDIDGNGVLVTPAGSSVPIAFADFSRLDAGAGSDSLMGPDGVDQTWTVTDTGSLTVPFTILSQIDDIEQFVGGDGIDTFEIAFDYVGDLSGGEGDDVFNIVGNVTGSLNGNAGSDAFNLQGGSATLIDGTGDGVGDSDTLVGADTVNIWNITSLDSGDVNGQLFAAIENLLGGAVMDTFNLGATVSGNVGGGAGNDMFLLASAPGVTVGGSIDGGDDDDMLITTVVDGDRAFTFDGGAGDDTVTLDGGGAGYTGAFSADAGTLAYTSAAQTVQTATLTGVETVLDEVIADTLTIDAGSQMAVDLTLGTTAGTDPLLATLGIVLDFSNKANLNLDATNADVTLTGPLAIAGTLDLDAGTLTSDGGTISATDLIIRNAMVMSALNTAVTSLTLDGVSGMFSLVDMGDLELLSSTAAGDITIEADGALNVGAGETVASTGSLTLRSSGDTVTTDGTVSAAALALDGATGLSIDGNLTGTNILTLTSGGAIDQAAGGQITTASLTSTSTGGLTLAGTGNAMAAVNASNTGGAMSITNASASTMNVTNTGGALSINNTGNLTLTGLSNRGGATDVTASGSLAMTGAINTAGGPAMTLTGGGQVSQTGAVSAAGDVTITGDTYVAGSSATTTSIDGNVTVAGNGDITVNDVSALNGSVVLSSATGDILAARPGAEIRSENITFLNLRRVGEALTPFAVFGLDGTLNLDTQNNSNPGIQLFINQFGKFTTIGPRAGNAVDQRAQAASAVFGQSLSATLSTGNAIDSSVFAEDLQVIGKVGRGVAIPCDQVEDEEEACQ